MMNRNRILMLLVILIMGSMIGNSFTFGYGVTARGYNVSFEDEREILIPQKSETVFSLLDSGGTVVETRVLNRLTGEAHANHKWVVDYGRYLKVNNMVSSVEPVILDGRLFWPVEMLQEGDIYYEGYTNKSLPVHISITYYLNGEAIAVDSLPGKKGMLEIRVSVENVLADYRPVDYRNAGGRMVSRSDSNYVPLVVQGTMPIDLRRFSQIEVSEGAVLEVGRTANASFMVFPYPKAQVTIRMVGENIELEPLSITVMPQMPPVTDIAMADDLKALFEGLSSIQEGMEDIQDGLRDIAAGTEKADRGIQELLASVLDGLHAMELGVIELNRGMDELYGGLQLADEGFSEFFSSLDMGTGEISAALMELYAASDQMLTGLEQLRDQLNAVIEPMIPALEVIDEMLEYLASVDSEEIVRMLDQMIELMDDLLEWIRLLPEDDIESAMAAHRQDLMDLTDKIEDQDQRIRRLVSTNTEIVKMAENLVEEHPEGSDLYKLGATVLEQNLQIKELDLQMEEMKAALGRLHTSGSMLESEVDDLIRQIIEKLEELMAEIAERNGLEPDYYKQFMDYFEELLLYLKQMNQVLPEIREQISQLILLPEYLDQLIEGQRMIRDGILMVHDEGILPLREGVFDAESKFSLQLVLDAVAGMGDGLQMLSKDGFQPLQKGLRTAADQLSLKPLVDAQEQINAGIGSLLRDGLVPMQQGLGEGLDDLLFAEEKLERMQLLADTYRSFADNERNQKSSVRFIMQTEPIRAGEDKATEDADPSEDKPLYRILWERFTALFKSDT